MKMVKTIQKRLPLPSFFRMKPWIYINCFLPKPPDDYPMFFSYIFRKNSHLGLKTFYGKSISKYLSSTERKYPDNLGNYFFFLPPLEKNPNKLLYSFPERFSFKKIFAWKGQVMFLNFNMLINCQIIISMELNLDSILIFNEITKTNLIVMKTNTFNDDWFLAFKKCIINILIFWGLFLTISFCFICVSTGKHLEGYFSPHLFDCGCSLERLKNFHCDFKHGMSLNLRLVLKFV